ncbi:MAG: peroxiredoxin-like family protein [bacterium]
MKALYRYAIVGIFSVSSGFFAVPVQAAKAAPVSPAPRVAASPTEIQPVKVGDIIPDVMLTNADGLRFNLKKLIKNQPTVLIFYRGGWCVYCNTQLGQLKQVEVPLQKLGYQIVAVSPDKVERIRESLKKYDLSYMLLSDADAEAIKGFGLAYQVDDATYNKMKQDYGIDLEEHAGKTHHLLPVPAAFVLNKQGKILFSYINPDYKVRVDSQALLKAAEEAVQPKAGSKS